MSVMLDPPELWRLCEFYQKTIKTCRQQKSGLDIRRPVRHITKKPRRISAGVAAQYI